MRRLNKKGNLRSDFGMSMRNIVKSKRAAEMTIGTLVVIVLAIIVLVVLALGFGMGWNSLWSKISPYLGGSGGGSNVASVKQACEILCDSGQVDAGSKDEYCTSKKTVILDSKTTKSDTCAKLAAQIGAKACNIKCAP